MKKLFLVVSAIEVNNDHPFNFGKTRSLFSDEERFRQTIYTLHSIRTSYPNDTIVVVDTSTRDTKKYAEQFKFFNANYIPLIEFDPEAHKIVTTHESINFCECYLLNSFFRNFKSAILEHDFLIKTTGRYVYSQFQNHFTEENVNKFFFKKRIPFNWNDGWGYRMIDLREKQGNNYLYQYSTVLYGFGTKNLNRMIDIFDAHNHVVEMTLPTGVNYDIESLSYFLTRPYEQDIIETDWKVAGFEGVHGTLMYY